MSNTEFNRKIIESYFADICSGNEEILKKAVDKYADDNFIQHNPNMKNGKAGLVEYAKKLRANSPDCRFSTKRFIADGDFVVVHSEVTGYLMETEDKDPKYVFVDIYRLENGKVVEHWDVSQRIPETTASGNPMI